ncbi:hypothetical protein AK965_07000 [Vibrio sp. PID17_43]|nr:hypothetical protein AK965_07000 [Vibrio sp. PID17_43]
MFCDQKKLLDNRLEIEQQRSRVRSRTFSKHFGDLKDPRQSAKISYPLFDVLFLAVCAIIAGAEGWEDIEDFGEIHLGRFLQKGLFKDGMPVHDTIARIVSRLDPAEFQACFTNWMQVITEGEIIAIDGKVLRGSYDRESHQSTLLSKRLLNNSQK